MTGRKILLVEGSDDEHVVKAICGLRNLGHIDLIFPSGGRESLLASIPIRIKESDVFSLGILIDADVNLQGCWDALKYCVASSGYILPEKPDPRGLSR